jgi:hypothetical protein
LIVHRSISELQAQNDDTLSKIYDNQNRIDASREWLLQDKAGIAPRMYHFDMDSVRMDPRSVLQSIGFI